MKSLLCYFFCVVFILGISITQTSTVSIETQFNAKTIDNGVGFIHIESTTNERTIDNGVG